MTAWWLTPLTTRSFPVSHPRLILDFAPRPIPSDALILRHSVDLCLSVMPAKEGMCVRVCICAWEYLCKEHDLAVVFERGDLARGRWVHRSSEGEFQGKRAFGFA